MARRHGYHFGAIQRSLLCCYLKKETPTECNVLIHQIGWCLANLVMMQTGVNKEVALTIPSKAEDGRSILTRGDGVFVSKDSTETEVHLHGYKAKVGNAPTKIIPIIIVKESPLYKMLVAYERYVKVAQDGPFFEFDESFIARWAKAGRRDFEKHYPVTDENGKQLSSIDTKRFRKVFASGQLLDRMKNINDMNDLAEMLRNDLNHEDFDTTLTNYLLKSSGARSVIDIAIATITGGKLNDLKCKSQIEVRKPIPFKKKSFFAIAQTHITQATTWRLPTNAGTMTFVSAASEASSRKNICPTSVCGSFSMRPSVKRTLTYGRGHLKTDGVSRMTHSPATWR